MAIKFSFKSNWDAIGIGASTACAIHCILLPLFFTTLPFFGIEIMENRAIEITMVAISLLVGSWALYNGYRKHHQHIWPLLVFIIGITCLVLGNVISENQKAEMLLKLTGACSIISAHGFNWWYCRRCAVCDKSSEYVKKHVHV